MDRKARPAEPIHDRCAGIIPSDAEPGGRYAKKTRGPEAVVAPYGFSQPGDARQSEPAPTLDESAAELADAYFDALFGKGPNPFDAADSNRTRSTAPIEIPAGEPGCVSTRTRGSVEDIAQRATGPRADVTPFACGDFALDAGLTALPESAPPLDLAGRPTVTGDAAGTGAPTVTGAPTHTRKPKPAPTLKGRRANAHDRDRTRKRRVRTPSKKRRARSATG